MSPRQRKAFKAIAIFLAFSFAQVYVQTSLAGPGASSVIPIPQQFVARLTTKGGAITMNGAAASSGATVLTGAALETPDQVSATIDLGALGTVELPPNSSIMLDFDSNGNVRVKILRGCAVLKKKGQGTGEIYTAEGASEKTNNKRKGLAFCYLNGALSSSGAGGAVAGGAAAAGAGGLFGLGTAATVGIIGGAAAVTTLVIVGTRGSNPSP
jgi:hypothetical protein